ncbi:MAG: vWA domain-containing protein [bacterium]
MKRKMITLSILCVLCILTSFVYADNLPYNFNNGYDTYAFNSPDSYSSENIYTEPNMPLYDEMIEDHSDASGSYAPGDGSHGDDFDDSGSIDKVRYRDGYTGVSGISSSTGNLGYGINSFGYGTGLSGLSNIYGTGLTGLSSGLFSGFSNVYGNFGSLQSPSNWNINSMFNLSPYTSLAGMNLFSSSGVTMNFSGLYNSSNAYGNTYGSLGYLPLNTMGGLYSNLGGLYSLGNIGYQGLYGYGGGMGYSLQGLYSSSYLTPSLGLGLGYGGLGLGGSGISYNSAGYGGTGYGGISGSYTSALSAVGGRVGSYYNQVYSYNSYSSYSGGYSGGSGGTNIGYSTGGAKDINNFRQNIENDYLPLVTDITYEGLYYDYYFDTGQQDECFELFCPSYNLAVSKDPFSENVEYFMSVGLNSGIKESDFERKKLNLVIVLDISGSMGATFSKYYYDRFGNQQALEQGDDEGKSKIQIATEAVVALIDHLNLDDRFGLITFESSADVYIPLQSVGQMDIQQIKNDVMEIFDRGGTALSEGMKKGTEQFAEYLGIDFSVYENRIIFITDAMPNIGDTGKTGLLGMLSDNADKKIYTTFIGVGVDFNTELVEYITKIRGANYYSVHSSSQFKERMDDQFEFMVTPLVFNLEMNLASVGYEIAKVYGSPEADEATGELMKVKTLFPSETVEEGVKGGIVLLHLKKLPEVLETEGEQMDPTELTLSVSYEDRLGNVHAGEKVIHFGDLEAEYFDNNGTRKAVLLARYANMIKNWIFDERTSLKEDSVIETSVTYDDGITIPVCVPSVLGEWERQSVALQVSEEYKQLFSEFKPYFEAEMAAIGDEDLAQEVEVLDKLINYNEN